MEVQAPAAAGSPHLMATSLITMVARLYSIVEVRHGDSSPIRHVAASRRKEAIGTIALQSGEIVEGKRESGRISPLCLVVFGAQSWLTDNFNHGCETCKLRSSRLVTN